LKKISVRADDDTPKDASGVYHAAGWERVSRYDFAMKIAICFKQS